MPKFVEMDEQVTLSKQMEEHTGPIVFMNKFSVNPDDVDEFLKTWAADAAVFRLSYIEGLLVAVRSLTMRFGNQLHISRMRSTMLTYKPEYQSILLMS
jgi:hypothetical protein